MRIIINVNENLFDLTQAIMNKLEEMKLCENTAIYTNKLTFAHS